MAFRFFRKRQKMVIIIMVVLMVSFLIGIQGFNLFFEKKPGQQVMGTVGDDEIKASQLNQARGDIDLLEEYMHLGSPSGLMTMRPTELEFAQLAANGNNAPMALALLDYEAEKHGLTVTTGEVETFMSYMMTAAEKQSATDRMHATGKLSLEDLQNAAGRWLLAYKSFTSAAAQTPPSEAEVQNLYRQLREEIDLLVAKVPAEKFVGSVPKPTPGAIQEQFDRYRDNFPQQGTDPFGFGYKQPDRVGIPYLLIRTDVVKRVARPSEEKITDYFRTQRRARPDSFMKEVWPGPGKVADEFLDDLLGDRQDEARKLILPGSAAQKALASLKAIKPSSGQATLDRVFADASSALAISSDVRAEGGAAGPLVIQLRKAKDQDLWQVEQFDVRTTAEAAKAETDFKAKHAGAKAVQKKSVPEELYEAEPKIIEYFSREVVGEKVESLVGTINRMLNQAADSGQLIGKDPYEWVVGQLKQSAASTLQTELSSARVRAIRGMPLDEAMKILAEAAQLGAICYPWGQHGKVSIPRDIRVTVDVQADKPITLGEALAQIDAEVFGKALASTQPASRPASGPASRPASQPATQPGTQPATRPVDVRLDWARCRTFQIAGRDVLFPVNGPEGLDLFPLRAGRAPEPLDREQLADDGILGTCSTTEQGRSGDRLVDAAFSARPFNPEGKGAVRAEVGKQGARMFAHGGTPDTSGVVLWRLAEAIPSFAPRSVDEVPGLKEQVVKDVEIKAAYGRAETVARELAAAAKTVDLKSEAQARGLETVKTGPFARRIYDPVRDMNMLMYAYTKRPEFLARAMFDKPQQFPYTKPENVDLPNEASQKELIETAFTLVPRYGRTTGPAESPRVAVVPVPAARTVLVIERNGYRPPVRGEFENPPPRQPGRQMLWQALMQNEQWEMRQTWFQYDEITKRLGFKPKEH